MEGVNFLILNQGDILLANVDLYGNWKELSYFSDFDLRRHLLKTICIHCVFGLVSGKHFFFLLFYGRT